MFSVEERDAIRQRLLDLASADPVITGAAITGSRAAVRLHAVLTELGA